MVMNDKLFGGMVDQRKALNLISWGTIVRDSHHRILIIRHSSSGCEPAQSSGFMEGSYLVVITTTPSRQKVQLTGSWWFFLYFF